MITIVPGPPIGFNDKEGCKQNYKILTHMEDKFMKNLARERQDKPFDHHQPTFAVRGGACVTIDFTGPADEQDRYRKYHKTPPPPVPVPTGGYDGGRQGGYDGGRQQGGQGGSYNGYQPQGGYDKSNGGRQQGGQGGSYNGYQPQGGSWKPPQPNNAAQPWLPQPWDRPSNPQPYNAQPYNAQPYNAQPYNAPPSDLGQSGQWPGTEQSNWSPPPRPQQQQGRPQQPPRPQQKQQPQPTQQPQPPPFPQQDNYPPSGWQEVPTSPQNSNSLPGNDAGWQFNPAPSQPEPQFQAESASPTPQFQNEPSAPPLTDPQPPQQQDQPRPSEWQTDLTASGPFIKASAA